MASTFLFGQLPWLVFCSALKFCYPTGLLDTSLARCTTFGTISYYWEESLCPEHLHKVEIALEIACRLSLNVPLVLGPLWAFSHWTHKAHWYANTHFWYWGTGTTELMSSFIIHFCKVLGHKVLTLVPSGLSVCPGGTSCHECRWHPLSPQTLHWNGTSSSWKCTCIKWAHSHDTDCSGNYTCDTGKPS